MKRAAVLVMAVLLAVAGCARPSASGGSSPGASSPGSSGAVSRGPSTAPSAPAPGSRASVIPAPTCPATVPGTTNTLPGTSTVSSPDRLVPDAPIRSALLCSYAGSNTAPMAGRPLGTHRTLTGDLTGLTTDLRFKPPTIAENSCTLAGGPQTDFLLGLRYDTGVLWVAAAQDPNDCSATTNGTYTALGNDGAQFAAALAAGRWVAPRTTTNDPCGAPGRWGQQDTMVPAGASSVVVCSGNTTTARRITTAADVAALTAALNKGSTVMSTHSCAQAKDPSTGEYLVPAFSQVRFDYPQGPAVVVRLSPGCQPEVDNGSLQSADATATLAVLRAISAK